MKKRTAKVFAMAIASLFVLSACSGTASNQTSTGETAGAAGATDTQSPHQPANRRAAIILRML